MEAEERSRDVVAAEAEAERKLEPAKELAKDLPESPSHGRVETRNLTLTDRLTTPANITGIMGAQHLSA